jgi:hypothetical protein
MLRTQYSTRTIKKLRGERKKKLPKSFVDSKIMRTFASANSHSTAEKLCGQRENASLAQLARARDL